jgi:hypothetical protein
MFGKNPPKRAKTQEKIVFKTGVNFTQKELVHLNKPPSYEYLKIAPKPTKAIFRG